MKITGVRVHKYWVHWRNWLFVRLHTDEGLFGWGEASLHGAVGSVEAAVHGHGSTTPSEHAELPHSPEPHNTLHQQAHDVARRRDGLDHLLVPLRSARLDEHVDARVER